MQNDDPLHGRPTMPVIWQSSGDMLADRRFGYAEALAAEGDAAAAADLFAQVAERVPGWAPAWLALGAALARDGQSAPALAALDRARDLDPEDRLGAGLRAARLRGTHPDSMPPGFVAALFDQYADRFDRHLQGSLGYRGPAVVAAAIECVAPGRRFGASLDLGCGTGLMARHLTDRTAALDGVDLSPRMIEQARATGLYRNLAVADLAQALRQSPDDAYDLILAADVFVYVGALDAVLQRIAAVLRPAGLLAFTVQHGDHPGFELGADMRFSHGSAYVEATLADAGLRVALIEAQSTRRDGGIDVPGLVVVATRA